MAELPTQLSAHVGAILDDTPIICGGFSDYQLRDECYTLQGGFWFNVIFEGSPFSACS